jgi:hypothetical protein
MLRAILIFVLVAVFSTFTLAQDENDGKSLPAWATPSSRGPLTFDDLTGKSDPVSAVPSPPGRYQIVMSPLNARDVFLLDTSTGRVWQRTTMQYLLGEPDIWEIVPRLDNDADLAKFERAIGFKSPKKTK